MVLDSICTASFGISSGFYVSNVDGGFMVGGLDFLAKRVTKWTDNPNMDCVRWSVELDMPIFLNSEKCCTAGLSVFTRIEWSCKRIELVTESEIRSVAEIFLDTTKRLEWSCKRIEVEEKKREKKEVLEMIRSHSYEIDQINRKFFKALESEFLDD